MHDGAKALLWSTAADRAKNEPARFRKAACRALRARWAALLSVAAQDALAATLMEEGVSLLDGVGGGPVSLAEVLSDFRGGAAVCESGAGEVAAEEVVLAEVVELAETAGEVQSAAA